MSFIDIPNLKGRLLQLLIQAEEPSELYAILLDALADKFSGKRHNFTSGFLDFPETGSKKKNHLEYLARNFVERCRILDMLEELSQEISSREESK